MQQFDLSDARMKIERARTHLAELDKEIMGFSAPHLYKIIPEHDINTGFVDIRLETMHDTDRSVSTVIGDAIGNLRSALDYLIGAIIEKNGADRSSVTFPFADDKDGFEGQVRSARLKLNDQLIDKFIELQAYRGGVGNSLWIVNKLRNIDKHRLFMTATQIAAIEVDFVSGGGTFTQCQFGIEAGSRGVCIRAPSADFRFTSEPRAIFTIFINEAGITFYTEASPFLHATADKIDEILTGFSQP